MHVADREPLQLRRRKRHGLGNASGVGDEQLQRFRVTRNEAHWRVVEPAAKECCDLRTRHPAAKEAGGCEPHDADAGRTSRPKKSVAVSQRQLRVTLARQAASPDIDGEQQITLSLPGGPFGSW